MIDIKDPCEHGHPEGVCSFCVTAEEASSFNSALLCAESGVLISQFLLYMQHQSIAPCYLFIGDSAQRLTGDEMAELKNAFITQLLNA